LDASRIIQVPAAKNLIFQNLHGIVVADERFGDASS